MFKDTEKILRSILLRNKFDVVSKEAHSVTGKSSILEDQGMQSKDEQVEVDVPSVLKGEVNKGGDELVKAYIVEDTHNPLVDQVETSMKNEIPAKEEAERVTEEKEVEAELVSEVRHCRGSEEVFGEGQEGTI